MIRRKGKNDRAWQTVKLIGGLLGIVLVMFFLNILFGGPGSAEVTVYPTGSTYSNSADGAELFYQLLDKLGLKVEQSRHPLDGYYLDSSSPDVIWHSGTGTVEVLPDEIDWVDTWVEKGGVLVLVGASYSPDVTATPSEIAGGEDALMSYWMEALGVVATYSEVTRITDYSESRGIRRLPVDGRKMPSRIGRIGIVNTYERQGYTSPVVYRLNTTDENSDDPTVIRDAHGIVIARKAFGKGWVYIVSDPYLFSNLLLQEADNALLGTSLAMTSDAGGSAKILFDEYHLGFVQTLSLADAARTPVGKSILYLGLIAAFAVGTAGARFGRSRKGQVPVGVSQRAFVEALAGLWQGANATTSAADALWRRYHGRGSVRKAGLDNRLDTMRKSTARLDDLMEIARKLDS